MGLTVPEDLREIRARIDRLDARILWLLRDREELVVRALMLKSRLGLPLRDEAREAEILRRAEENGDSMRCRHVPRNVFRAILDGSRKLARWEERACRTRSARS